MKISNVEDNDYELVLDERGFCNFATDVLVGELRMIKFSIPDSMVLSPFRIKMFIDDILIMDEQIDKSEFYVLKIQPRDGFSQHWSMSNDFYVLNDVVRIEVTGIPDNSLFVKFRMKEV